MQDAIGELNQRMREAHLPFHFHNGLLQITDDSLSEAEIHNPFWNLVADPKWSNVDRETKEAFDRRDNHKQEVALSAIKALESGENYQR
jgi:hypothetical protein